MITFNRNNNKVVQATPVLPPKEDIIEINEKPTEEKPKSKKRRTKKDV